MKARFLHGALCALAIGILVACGNGAPRDNQPATDAPKAPAGASAPGETATAAKTSGGWKTLDDLATGRFATITGYIFAQIITQKYPTASVTFYSGNPDMIAGLQTNKVDAVLTDSITARVIMKSSPGLAILSDDFYDMPLGVGFRKDNPDLRQRFNRFLAQIKADGTWDAMYRRWFVEDPETAVMPEFPVTAPRERLTAGVSVADLPYIAVMDGKYVGFDIEMLKRFAATENIDLRFTSLEFAGLIASLAAGKVQIIADGIAISEERARMIDFSDSYMTFKTVAVVKASNMAAAVAPTAAAPGASAASGTSAPATFFQSIATSFQRNIIVERRWKLILDGLWATIIMSILSTLFGTLMGGLVCAMRLSRHRFGRAVATAYIEVLRGLPIVVLLMLIFYVAFASVNIDPVIVAVLAFGLNFGAYVAEIFRSGIEGIERGQMEAGIAMGFTKSRSFLYIVMPQALRRILPVYRGEFISLVKATSIVGYIGVQDLTKASDIIRSRTFDAFFPLVMVAVIYFLPPGSWDWPWTTSAGRPILSGSEKRPRTGTRHGNS